MFEAIKYFFYLGCLGFGGPLAAIATMQKDLVERRQWISEEEFLRVFAILKAMPGPVSYQMVVFLGSRRAGRLGGILSGIAFILPAFALMILMARAQQTFAQSTWLDMLLRGFQAAALALIASSFRSLTKPYWGDPIYWIIGTLVILAALTTHLPEPIFIVGAGLITLGFDLVSAKRTRLRDLATLFWICFKAGAFVFGTGLAIIPLMQEDFVTKMHVAPEQFLNALAFGQVTPGPVVISASYLGYLTDGFWGACVATMAIFLACTFHMITWFPVFLRRFGTHSALISFTRGAIAAVSAFILLFCFRSVQSYETTILILTGAMIFLIPYMPGWLLVPIGGAASAIIFSLSGH